MKQTIYKPNVGIECLRQIQHKYVYWMAAWKSSTNIFTVKPWTGNYGDETAGNVQDDIVNTNICTEWRPGILRTKQHYQTHLTHVMSTENIQQDGGEETQIHIPDDGIRNFEDKTSWNFPPNTIYSRNKNDVLHLWIFQQAEIALTRKPLVRISAFWNWFQIKLETVCLPRHNAL